MKVMHIIPYIKNESAGTTHVVISLCQALTRNGCEVTLYTLDPVPPKTYGFNILSFHASYLPHPSLGRSRKMYDDLIKNAKQYDVIHNHMLWMAPSYYSGLVASKLDIPLITAPHGTLSKWALNRSKWKKKISMLLGQKKSLDAVSCFHVTAESEKKDIQSLGYKSPCVVIANGIDIPKRVRKTNAANKKSIVFMSRIHPKKGVDILISAWAQLQDSFKDWELVIIGPSDHDNYTRKVKKLAKNLGVKRVYFKGEVVGLKKEQYLMSASLFVFPTYSENFGMVVAEALACGTPVISTKGAPWKGLEDHNAGWWIDIGIESLVTTLSKCMKLDQKVLNEMGENGRQWMRDEYSWDEIAQDMIKTYSCVINQQKQCNVIKDVA